MRYAAGALDGHGLFRRAGGGRQRLSQARDTDIRTLIEDEAKCGYWCPADDADGFAETVKRIVSERERLAEYGRNGREYLISHFNVERSVDILESAVKRKRKENGHRNV